MPESLITPKTGNIAELLFLHASQTPSKVALVVPSENGDTTYTYLEMQKQVCSLMAGLRAQGIQKDDRILILFPVAVELYTLIAAIYAIGAVAVLIDVGMGVSKILSAVQTAKPRAIVSVRKLLQFRWLIPTLWRIEKKFSLDSQGWGILPFSALTSSSLASPDSIVPREKDAQALITFTSGSTGAPKGANRHHRFLLAQHHALLKSFPLHENQIDMTCFPVVVFHNLSCGITTILPNCDISKPASVDSDRIIAQIHQYGITSLSAAPIFVQRLMETLKKTKQTLPSLKQLATGGAPISVPLQEGICEVLPQTDAIAVYGSTEAEPMAHHHISLPCIDNDAFIAGKPVSFVQLKIVSLPNPPPRKKDLSQYETNDVGEIIVAGEHVNEGYIDNPKANAENKLIDHNNTIWHRTGDRGYKDDSGCLWLTGRTNDVVLHNNTLYDPFPLESQLLRLPSIKQVALIEKNTKGYLFLASSVNPQELLRELRASNIEIPFALCLAKALPVDGRHNSKIDRPQLRKWLKYSWWYTLYTYTEYSL